MSAWPKKHAAMIMALYATSAMVVSAQQTSPSAQNLQALATGPDGVNPVPEVVRISPERNFGYVVGDVLRQHINLPVSFTPADLSELSRTVRVSTWLERQRAFIETIDGNERTLTLRYQIINAPQSIISVALPELTLTPSTGESITVPAWPFTLGPLTASKPESEPSSTDSQAPAVEGMALKADMTLPRLDEGTPATRLRLALTLLALTLASWAAWYVWRNQRDKVRLPFAQALQILSSRKQRQPDDSDVAWKALHHAFNQSAGAVVNTSSIDTLLDTHDWLRPLEPRIRSFYAASAARHYALPARNEPYAVEELARALADCERRNSR